MRHSPGLFSVAERARRSGGKPAHAAAFQDTHGDPGAKPPAGAGLGVGHRQQHEEEEDDDALLGEGLQGLDDDPGARVENLGSGLDALDGWVSCGVGCGWCT